MGGSVLQRTGWLVALCALFSCFGGPAFGQPDEYRIGPLPAWVKPLPADAEHAVPLDQISAGTCHLLSDTQVHLADRDTVIYPHRRHHGGG